MALVSCPECGKQVSSTAIACPKCGYAVREHFNNTNEQEHQPITETSKDSNIYVEKNKTTKKVNKKSVLIISAVLVVVVGILILLLKPLSPEQIYKIVSPATVEIHVQTDNGESIGTGFFDDNNGTIITNYHVIERGYEGTVYVKNAGAFDIESIIGYDKKLDIAIIQIDYKSEVVLNKRTDDLKVGETVYALGSSEGLTDSFSSGLISAVDRKIENTCFIQTTAPISHGNSGGPLVDSKGNVIGITSAGVTEGQNLNLAIPIYDIEKINRDEILTFTQFYNLTDPDRPAYADINIFLGVLKGDYEGTIHLYSCEKVEGCYNTLTGEVDASVRNFSTVKKALEAGFHKHKTCTCIDDYWKHEYNAY